MRSLQHITTQWLTNQREKLLEFSGLTEETIRDIWGGSESIKDEDLTKIKYRDDCPLYHKMIFRFRQYDRSASRLANTIDLNNKTRLLFRYRLEGQAEIIEFLAWIKNGLGIYDLYTLAQPDLEEPESSGEEYDLDHFRDSPFHQIWKINEIRWFFDLPIKAQNQLIERYNTECVDAYNRRIRDEQ